MISIIFNVINNNIIIILNSYYITSMTFTMSSQSILIGCVQRHDEASDTTAHAPYKPITAVVKNVLVYTAG